MKKLLPLILILFAAPCFGDPDNTCLHIISDLLDTDTNFNPEDCKKGDLMTIHANANAKPSETNLHYFASNLCDFNYSVVISEKDWLITCVFRRRTRIYKK